MAYPIRYLVVILAVLISCDAYKILIISPMPSKSHSILGYGLAKHLVNAGHEVTLVTSSPSNKQRANLTEIDIGDKVRNSLDDRVNVKRIMDKEFDVLSLSFVITTLREVSVLTLEHDNVQKLISDPKQQFDLVIAEWMFNELYSSLSAIFDCHFIWFSSSEPFWMVLRLIDESPNPAYNQDILSMNVPPLTFVQRVQEMSFQIIGMLYHQFVSSRVENEDYEQIVAPLFKKRGKTVPSFEEVKRNVSLVLGNSHESLGQTIRLPLSYKAIAGFHIDDKVEPLPQDLKKVMDNAKHGVIYFSMGSNVKSKELPDEIKKELMKMFGGLKQTVIWKFEEDLPNRPKNVHIVQWAPQHSVLAHKNCILFITHGGYLSLTETIHFGVPVIGIPVFGDQFSNMVKAVNKGYAKKVDLSYSMVEDLKVAIADILNDPKYTKRAKELSHIYHDRPVTPGAEMVHWVEHVIRTGGALHLRSPAFDLPWYQKLYLDLVALLLAVFILLKYFFWYLFALCTKETNYEKKRK
ncbi:UDP-glucosyltransferase 2-like [Battus philenor]|uniref:UDP-glucosyltransferase 2-like n=1 Tax=Battus philenor TaxID=42288 RepID=UPI0035D0A47E